MGSSGILGVIGPESGRRKVVTELDLGELPTDLKIGAKGQELLKKMRAAFSN